MNPNKRPVVTAQMLLDLRGKEDAVRLITELLRVKEMGPADHIRTKHEAKIFVESGDMKAAETLVASARERHGLAQTATQRMAQSNSQRMGL